MCDSSGAKYAGHPHKTDSKSLPPKTALAAQVCGEEWEDRVALDAGGAAHLTERAQFERIMAAGYLAFDQAPLLQVQGRSRPAGRHTPALPCSSAVQGGRRAGGDMLSYEL